MGGATILALGGLAAIAPLAAVGAGALFVGYLGRNYLYDYADRLNAGQTDAQAIQGSLIGNTPALGGLYRGLTNTDPGTGASLNLSHFEQGNQFGSGLGEAALVVGGPQLYRVGNATARAASDVVTSLRARAALYGPESAGVPAGTTAPSSNVAAKKGGLNLFKWGQPQTETPLGWRTGDRMLALPDQGTPQLNWQQNAGALRSAMRAGQPIFDSYVDPVSGQQIPTGGFLNAERYLLESRGWQFNPTTGAYHPPGS